MQRSDAQPPVGNVAHKRNKGHGGYDRAEHRGQNQFLQLASCHYDKTSLLLLPLIRPWRFGREEIQRAAFRRQPPRTRNKISIRTPSDHTPSPWGNRCGAKGCRAVSVSAVHGFRRRTDGISPVGFLRAYSRPALLHHSAARPGSMLAFSRGAIENACRHFPKRHYTIKIDAEEKNDGAARRQEGPLT